MNGNKFTENIKKNKKTLPLALPLQEQAAMSTLLYFIGSYLTVISSIKNQEGLPTP